MAEVIEVATLHPTTVTEASKGQHIKTKKRRGGGRKELDLIIVRDDVAAKALELLGPDQWIDVISSEEVVVRNGRR